MRNVADRIASVRNHKIILDADVALLYGVETKRINEAVRNNPDKFPSTYMFQLSKDEVEILRTKISSTNYSAKSRSLPYAFTEKGLYMLATILKSKTAINTTFAIIETFAAVRELKRELVELHKEGDKFHCQGCRKPASDYTKLSYRLLYSRIRARAHHQSFSRRNRPVQNLA